MFSERISHNFSICFSVSLHKLRTTSGFAYESLSFFKADSRCRMPMRLSNTGCSVMYVMC